MGNLPQTPLWATLAGMCLIVTIRYFLTSGLFAAMAKKRRPDVYAPTEPAKAARLARQIRREIGWSVVSAILYGLPAGWAAYLWQSKGLTFIYTDPQELPLFWLVASPLLYLLIHDAWFFWTHWAMHRWNWLFKKAHAVHHDSRPPTAWAAMSFHPWEALSAAWLIPLLTFIIPIHAISLLVVLSVMTFFGVTNHMGYEIFPHRWVKGWMGRHLITASHHHIHHERYRSNYGLYFRFWDKLMGTDQGISPDLMLKRPPPKK